MSSFHGVELPSEVIKEIVSCISDPVSICRLAGTCSGFHEVISDNDSIWEGMCKTRWKKNSGQGLSRAQYERRHALDKSALVLLQEMSATIQEQDLSSLLGSEWQHPNWTRLRSREFGNDINELAVAIARGDDEYPTLMATMTNDDGDWKFVKCFAGFLVDAIFHHDVMREWHLLIQSAGSSLSAQRDDRDSAILETGALLLVKSQMLLDDILDGHAKILQEVVDHLDEFGNEFQAKLDSECVPKEDTVRAIAVLNVLLLEEGGYGGNVASYYEVCNSLINDVLETRRGIPITLAVIYKCVCRRVGIRVDIIGLPGHVVLGIPPSGERYDEQLFVDVFNDGKILTLNDCQLIAASYGHAWRQEFVQPLKATKVLTRMLNNIMNCREKKLRESNNSQMHALRLEKTRALSMLTQLHYSPHTYMLLEIWPERMPLVLDPEIFLRYGVTTSD